MKMLPLSCTPNIDKRASSEYLVPLCDTTRLRVPAADNTYRIQSSKIIESHVFEIILLVKVMLI